MQNTSSESSRENETSMKGALMESLMAILSHDQAVRSSGEKHLKSLEIAEEYGLYLAELVINPDGPLAIRQLSSILLKQYIEAHWVSWAEKFVSPEVNPPVKATIRQLLVVGLKEPISKIRSSVAYVISTIATWDWPDAWPDLFNILMEGLSSGNHDYTHGSMRVLTEFCREITGNQLNQIAPSIFPQLCTVLQGQQIYGVRTRSRAVDIFTTITNLIAEVNDKTKGPAKHLLFPILPQFLELFMVYLRTPDGLVSDRGLKTEVLKALMSLLRNFPHHMSKWIQHILEATWITLTTTTEQYVQVVVNNLDEIENPVDSDCEVLGFENLLESIFDLIHVLLESSKFRLRVKKASEQLFYYIILCMQITEEQIQSWSSNPNMFVEDEEEESYMYSVRTSARELLLTIFEHFPNVSVQALYVCSQKHIQQADELRAVSDVRWWKIYEATLQAVSSVYHFINVNEDENKTNSEFDVIGLLQNYILPILSQNVSPFLIGRGLWLASRFSTNLPPELLDKFMSATVASISSNQSTCLRICGIKSINEYCEHLKTRPTLLQPHIEGMVRGIISAATEFNAQVLVLCLESLAVILEVDEHFTVLLEPDVSHLIISIFLRYGSDPIVVSLSQDIFTILAKNKLCILPLQHRIMPTLITILQSPIDKIPFGLQSVSLEILTVLVRNSTFPLEDVLIHQAFPAAYQFTLTTDDNSALQNGGECMRAFVSVALEQLLSYHDDKGFNGVYYVVQIIGKLLDPKTSEFTATYVGKLVNVLISKMGSQLGDDLQLLLKAVLSKLQQAETLTVIQSLVLVFARLFQTQLTAVVEFLSSVPSPSGVSALEFVLNEWCAKQHLFFGDYDRKVSSVALCKLVEYSITSNDQRLHHIKTQGEQIADGNDGCIRTRSKSAQAPEKWTMIPLLVKMYKLLVNELSNQIEQNLSKEELDQDENANDDDDDNEQDDTGDDNDCNSMDDDASGYSEGGNLFDDLKEYETDGEEQHSDPDADNDPVNQIDLQAYITEFLRTLSQQPCYRLFSEHHNDSERKVLSMVGIPV